MPHADAVKINVKVSIYADMPVLFSERQRYGLPDEYQWHRFTPARNDRIRQELAREYAGVPMMVRLECTGLVVKAAFDGVRFIEIETGTGHGVNGLPHPIECVTHVALIPDRMAQRPTGDPRWPRQIPKSLKPACDESHAVASEMRDFVDGRQSLEDALIRSIHRLMFENGQIRGMTGRCERDERKVIGIALPSASVACVAPAGWNFQTIAQAANVAAVIKTPVKPRRSSCDYCNRTGSVTPFVGPVEVCSKCNNED